MEAEIDAGLIMWFGKDHNDVHRGKTFLDADEGAGSRLRCSSRTARPRASRLCESSWARSSSRTPRTREFLLGGLSLVTGADPEAIVLDFFAGSGSTGHAVMDLNAADGGQRRYILVQLDEAVDHPDYNSIASIARERLRRAGAQAKQAAGLLGADLDFGFRSLHVATTNMADVLRTPDAVDQDQLELYSGSVKPDRTGEDLLFQVLLDWGLELTMSIAVEQIDGHEVFVVEDGALVACFDDEVSPGLVREVAEREPLRAVFRDSGFASDADRINAEQIFAEVSPSTDVKAI